MSAYLNICRFVPVAGGITDWTVGTAVNGFVTPATAGAIDGTVYSYRAESADYSQWEVGFGTITNNVLARTTVMFNNLGTAEKINFAVIPQVAIVALKEDLLAEAPIDDKQYIRCQALWEDLDEYVDVHEAPTDGKQYARQSATWAIVQSTSGATTGEWTFHASTSAPPASGQVRFDQVSALAGPQPALEGQSAATKVWINNVTATSIDAKRLLGLQKKGTMLLIQDKDDSSKFMEFELASDPIDNITYWEFPVTFKQGGGNLPEQRILVAFSGGPATSGAVGPPGPQGDPGPIGPQGPQGDPGAQGAVGPQGEIGPQGSKGDTGSAGMQGPKGDTGSVGAVGPDGPQGVPGSIGPQGVAGPQGSEGPQGIQGSQGAAGTGITMKGSVATQGDLPATATQGDAYIVQADDSLWIYDGTKWVSGGSIQGPPGAQGPQGPQGVAGAQGGAGAQGPQGPAGADSMVPGPQGPKGDQGAQGATGTAGAQGPKGDTGAQGTPGTAGVTGPQGPIGNTGSQGPQGTTGATGPAGPTAVSANAPNMAKLGTDNLLLVTDAPSDGSSYGRLGAAWAKVVALVGGTMVGVLNLKGITDGSEAAAGVVGEYLIASNSTGTALTTGVAANVAQLALTAGDYRIDGVVAFIEAANTVPTQLLAGASQTSATIPTLAQVIAGQGGLSQINVSMTKGVTQFIQAGLARINVSAPTTVYLVAQSTFSGGTLSVQGRISARRMR